MMFVSKPYELMFGHVRSEMYNKRTHDPISHMIIQLIWLSLSLIASLISHFHEINFMSRRQAVIMQTTPNVMCTSALHSPF